MCCCEELLPEWTKKYNMNAYERFLDYVSYPTTSSETSETTPSTECQLDLARHIRDELESIGLEDVKLDEYGYVYACLPASEGVPDDVPTIGFIAHMDTSDACSGENIVPQMVIYSGGDILLNEDEFILMRRDEHPILDKYQHQCLICTDGKTLLGADDKAGIAEIITAVEDVIKSGEHHGRVMIAFTPDEEIGRGADHFDIEGFGADFAYTVDGGAPGELEYECFNGAAATVTIHGISMHPGTAKGKMKNACAIAAKLHSLLPQDEVPEKTEGREGFFHLCSMSGDVENAVLHYIIRDHSGEILERRKSQMRDSVAMINREYGDVAEVEIVDTYRNMAEILTKPENEHILERARAAMRSLGLDINEMPIRGGTDGARLSFMGLPCPNLPTGGVNCHSRFEFLPIADLTTCTDIVHRIITDAVKV